MNNNILQENQSLYHVLWVEDEWEFARSLIEHARRNYKLEIQWYPNWEKAKEDLQQCYNQYSAIILDARCALDERQIENDDFLHHVFAAIEEIRSDNGGAIIPWYIFSAGKLEDDFNVTMKSYRIRREKYKEEWGEMVYRKGSSKPGEKRVEDALFEQVRKTCENSESGIIVNRHRELFDYVGKDKYIDSKARDILLKSLRAMYYPEKYKQYECQGNPLRKTIEYMFRAAKKYGLLPDLLFTTDNSVIIADASKFMCGMNVECKNNYQGITARWGNPGTKKFGKGGDTIFNDITGAMLWNIILFTNSDSHTIDEENNEQFSIDTIDKEIFFSYVLQLCHIIKEFGQFVKYHPNPTENAKMHKGWKN